MSAELPLVRQWILLRSLCSRGCWLTVRKLAEESGVSEKTIRRDLATFRFAGLPIDAQTGEFGRKFYRFDPRWSKPDIGFTFDEALTLYLGRKLLQPLAGTICWCITASTCAPSANRGSSTTPWQCVKSQSNHLRHVEGTSSALQRAARREQILGDLSEPLPGSAQETARGGRGPATYLPAKVSNEAERIGKTRQVGYTHPRLQDTRECANTQ